MYHEFTEISGRLGLYGDRTPVLLAVSGGIDSMCMADLFLRAGLHFAVAHCNFHLRGEESDADEALVRDWAASAGIRFHHRDFDTAAFAAQSGQSIEMAARELRYRWFSQLCREEGYKALCVAHNANDNAETLFLNLTRGTGLHGLTGMGYESMIPCHEAGDTASLLRPLLSFTRKQIEGYVRARSVRYRDDRTNAMTEYRRNRIRHIVFPVFEQMNPSFIRTVSNEMSFFASAEAAADAYADAILESAVEERDGEVFLESGRLFKAAQWEYALYRFLDRYGFNSSVTTSLTDLLKSDRTISGKRFDSLHYTLLTTASGLVVRKCPPVAPAVRDAGAADIFTVVRMPGHYRCNGKDFSVEIVDRNSIESLRQPAGILLMDADAVGMPFVCRNWRDGDWFVPFGMRGKKKVSDFFTDLKYDIFRKRESVMVVSTSGGSDGSRVAAVLGERIDDSFKVTSRTASVLVLKVG